MPDDNKFEFMKYLVYIVVVLSLSFTAWTANRVIDMPKEYVAIEQYREDLKSLYKSISTTHQSIDAMKDMMYKFHLEKE